MSICAATRPGTGPGDGRTRPCVAGDRAGLGVDLPSQPHDTRAVSGVGLECHLHDRDALRGAA
jgi:hypothetical protein